MGETVKWVVGLALPTIFATIIGILVNSVKRVKAEQETIKDTIATKNKAMELGVQALLRGQLIDNYNRYKKKGYAPIYAKDNFENMYRQYEALGENGVIDHIYNEFMNLPTGD